MTPGDQVNAALRASIKARQILPQAESLIVSGEASKFASSRALLSELLALHRFRHGPASTLDDQARALNRVRELRKQGRDKDSIARQVFAEFPALDNFASILKKPNGRQTRRARELKPTSTQVTKLPK